MATQSSILAWKIPWTEDPGRLQSHGVVESDMTERIHFFTFLLPGLIRVLSRGQEKQVAEKIWSYRCQRGGSTSQPGVRKSLQEWPLAASKRTHYAGFLNPICQHSPSRCCMLESFVNMHIVGPHNVIVLSW